MERYIISLDLDGTLLNHNSKISFKTKHYLRQLAKKGHVVIINTGRPYTGCLHIYKKLKIYNYPLCCNNGAVLAFFKNNQVSFESTYVDNKTMNELYNEVKPYVIKGYALNEYEHYFFNMDQVPPFIQKYHKPKNPIFTTIDELLKMPIVTYTLYFDKQHVETVEKIFDNPKYANLRRIYWGIHDDLGNFSFAASHISKATAIKRMQDIYHIDDDHVIAFGDSYNDLDMLSYAHFGVCMCNGRKDMVIKAPLVTKKDNDHNGIVDYLKNNFFL